MKARFFGLIFVLAIVAGGFMAIMSSSTVQAMKCSTAAKNQGSCDGWVNQYSQYCKKYTNLGLCGSTSGEKWLPLLQNNDAAITTPTSWCGFTCSSNFFSTSSGSQEKTNPDDKISVPGGLKNSDTLPVRLYSTQRANDESQALYNTSTYELYVHSYIGSNFSYTPKSGKKVRGYIDPSAGPCDVKGSYIDGYIVIQRPAISKSGYQASGNSGHLGKYGGTPNDIVNSGVNVSFNVGWLRKTAADYEAGKLKSKYVDVFQGLFYHGAGSANASGCADIQLNAASIKLVPTGDIYPRLSSLSVSNSVTAGSDTERVKSSMTNSQPTPYQVKSSAAAYDFKVSSVDASKIAARFGGKYSTRQWNAGTNSVSDLCGALPGLFGSAIGGFSQCTKAEGPYNKNQYAGGTSGLDGAGRTLQMSNDPVGTIRCRVLVVNNFNGDNNGKTVLRSSAPACYIVGKQPKLQIWGGDLRTGGDVTTSQSSIRGGYYGSWAEYGAFIGGLNQNSAFATAAAFSGPNGAATSVASQLNQMTFANSGVSGGGYGKFADPKLAQPAPVYQVMADNHLNIPKGAGGFTSNISGLSGDYQVGNVTINSSKIPAGKTILIRSSGTVTINGNISYAQSNFTSLGSIPQVIIVAKNIKITDKPTQINAWLLSQNSLNTCSNGPAALTTTTCKNELQVNGPTASNSAQFRRTHGSDGASSASDPAETLNLRADAYLWEYRQASQKITPTTVQITQLPPRY